jgi:hypothetical protein
LIWFAHVSVEGQKQIITDPFLNVLLRQIQFRIAAVCDVKHAVQISEICIREMNEMDDSQLHPDIKRVVQVNFLKDILFSFPPKALPALPLSELIGAQAATSSQSQKLVTLQQDFISNEFHIPSGSIISTTPDGRNVSRFYTKAKGRIFRVELPSHSLVWFEGVIALVLSPQESDVNGYPVQAGDYVPIDGDGKPPFLRLSKQTTLITGFVAPAGSGVSFQSGLPFFVRLSSPTTFRGLSVNAGRLVCFFPDGTGVANVPLAADSSYEEKTFPAESNLIMTSEGKVLRAVLSRPTTFDGFQVFRLSSPTGPKPLVTFHPNGHLRSGFLTSITTIKGITIKPGFVRLFDNGNLEIGTLEGNQTIAGVPCLGGADIILSDTGEPIVFTAAADWSIGATHLHRGDRFTGTFKITGETVILDPASLSTTLNDVQNQICDKLAAELRKNSSKFPFGRIGSITKHDFRSAVGADHADLHQEIAVKDMLTNPPFADCDSEIAIDATLKWTLVEGFRRPTFKAWISSLGGGISHNFCPGTSLLEAGIAIGNALGLVNFNLASPNALTSPLALKQIDDGQMTQILAFLNSLHPEGRVLDWSFKPTRIFIDHQQLKLAYEYEVQRSIGGNH